MTVRPTDRRRFVVSLGAMLLAPALARAQAPRPLPRDFDAYVARALKAFDVPGAGVAIVKDGHVVLAKGYGVRRLGDTARVDADTRFQIASNTKAFTAAALAMLVDEGKLRWDDHVTRYLPWFQLADPWVTREFTVRDLLTHRSGLGLGAGDLVWMGTDYPRDTVVWRLRNAPIRSSFRSRYAYDNVLYVAAGQLIPAITGESWDDFVRERIFDPLGMTGSSTSVSALRPGDDIAWPHGVVDDTLRVIARDTVDNIGPAGAINAGVADLARWMIAQLDSGRLTSGGRLWSAARTRDMWSGTTIIPISDPAPSLAALRPQFAEYGFGWQLRDYRGHKLVLHTGGLAGMTSRTLLVPDLKLGIVVLTNGESSAYDAIAFRALDAYLGAPPTDWTAAFLAARDRERGQADAVVRRAAATRDTASRPSLTLARYAGRYTDALYGDATIALEDGHLVLRFAHSPAYVADLEHWQYDTFVARWRRHTIPDAYVTFALDPDGSIDTMRMAAVSPLADFSYDYQDLLFRPAPAEAPRAAGGNRP